MRKSIGRRCILKDKIILKLKSLGEKIKSSRKAQLGLAILVVMIVIVCYFAFLSPKSTKYDDSGGTTTSTSAADSYARSLEDQLESILSNVKGAGKVKVMVTLGSGYEYVYATEQTIKQSANGTTTTTTEVLLVDGQPVIAKEIFPSIQGVLVSASGAGDAIVKLNLVTAIQTVVDVPNSDITILTAN